MLKKNLIIVGALAFTGNAFGQQKPELSVKELAGQRNVITTSVPFLTITPDSRSAGMGDAGVARDADANSIHWNMASLAFIQKRAGMSLNAAPWLRQLVPDVWFYHMAGYSKVGSRDRSVIAASIRYFSLGEIQFTDDFGNTNGNATPYELAIDLGYSTQLSENLSLGGAMRFVNSCLTCGSTGVVGSQFKPGRAAAGDIGVYYKKPIKMGGKDVKWALGATITNIGNKITYSTSAEKDFIPTNLRLGTSFGFKIDDHNEVNFNFDINKLMVPTYPVYWPAANGGDSLDADGKKVVQYGKENKDVPVITGMFQSFGDAPGGFREELKEYIIATGIEYWYDKQFAVRVGYFNESETKGGRKYATFGIGLRYNVFGIDAAYLQPFAQRHPLQNTIRFSLLFDIDAFKKQQDKK
ncbi:MAG: type IX secretion system outer membrane channel protein PorV [Bacteroidia bacterium]